MTADRNIGSDLRRTFALTGLLFAAFLFLNAEYIFRTAAQFCSVEFNPAATE